MSKISNYLPAIGAVRVRETKLLTEANVEKILAAKSFSEAFSFLNELDFGEFLDEAKRPEEFEKVLTMTLAQTKRFFDQYAPNSPELGILWLQYDLHNAKVLLKGLLMKDDPEAFLESALPYGSRTLVRLKNLCLGQKQEERDEWVRDAFIAAKETFSKTHSPLEAEFVLDEVFVREIVRLARKTGRKHTLRFVRTFIDSVNILTAYRFLLRGEKNMPLLRGGKIARTTLLHQSLVSFGENFRDGWSQAVRNGREEFEKTKNLLAFSQELEAQVFATLEPAKYLVDGPEPLIAFFWRKQRDAQILRTLLVGKRAGFSPEILRTMLPSLS